MKRRPLVAGNWKMNKTPQETQSFIERFLVASPGFTDCDVLLIPSFTSLDCAGRLLSESSAFLGAQDMHFEPSGAFTGATSATMLSACGCDFVLVGHSERRHVFGDSDELVNRKLHAALENKLRPILCLGETLAERQSDQTEAILQAQLSSGLQGIGEDALSDVVIAYEPVWAIGTGETATAEQAQKAIAFLRAGIRTRYGKQASDVTRILYGGSVTVANARSLQDQPDIDGALIGGASLDPGTFVGIIEAVQSAQGDVESC